MKKKETTKWFPTSYSKTHFAFANNRTKDLSPGNVTAVLLKRIPAITVQIYRKGSF